MTSFADLLQSFLRWGAEKNGSEYRDEFLSDHWGKFFPLRARLNCFEKIYLFARLFPFVGHRCLQFEVVTQFDLMSEAQQLESP